MQSHELEAKLLKAHEGGHLSQLAALYEEAAVLKQAEGDVEAHYFLLTQAYVFALDCGDGRADRLRQVLSEAGREA